MSEKATMFSTTGITDSVRMLHTPSEFARKNLLYIQEVGQLKSLQPHKSQREKLDSFLFLCVLSGSGTLTIQNAQYPFRKGDCALINCDGYYAHESSMDDPWELMWVHFSGLSAKAYYELFWEQNKEKNLFLINDFKKFCDKIKLLMDYQKEKDLTSELLSGAVLLQLLNQCLFSVMEQEKDNQVKHKKMCNEIREGVNEKYKEKNLLSYYSKKFNFQPEDLDTCFQTYFGITLRDYILNRKFTAAKELLRFTIKPIEEVMKMSGIQDEDLFRRLFQESEGMTAEEYRMKWAQWVK